MDTIIISLGGSLIFPDENGPDTSFLNDFRKLILEESDKGKRFIIITGGGHINRMYNKSLREIVKPAEPDDETLDWLGISATAMNAFFIKCIFEDHAYEEVMHNPTEKIDTDKRIIIGCGWKPGCSSDKDAVLAAETFKADTVINLSNIDYAYTKDPRKHNDAEKIENIDWKEFRKIVGDEWNPKLEGPFDPVAAKHAEKIGIKVIIAKGTDLDNLKDILQDKSFKGTIVS
ncbi:UMP kinase [Candidatus Woesearchaeota archaeon]|nr:UMP kinase [Candidatus Woesearchaeota archaeon]